MGIDSFVAGVDSVYQPARILHQVHLQNTLANYNLRYVAIYITKGPQSSTR